MTGMDAVIELRRAGLRPRSVFVDLVFDAPDDPDSLAENGIVNVNISCRESLADIDFRPLVGLRVFLSDFTGNSARHRIAGLMVAKVEPSHLVMPVWEGETLAVHQRWAGSPVRTETTRV